MGSWWVQWPLAADLPQRTSIVADWETGLSHQPNWRWCTAAWLDATTAHFIDLLCKALQITETHSIWDPARHHIHTPLQETTNTTLSTPLFSIFICFSFLFFPHLFYPTLSPNHTNSRSYPFGGLESTFWPFPSVEPLLRFKLTCLSGVKWKKDLVLFMLMPKYCWMVEVWQMLNCIL